MSGIVHSGLGPGSVEMTPGLLNSLGNSSGPSVGASSLVTDANSGLSCRPQLQRSASVNNESYIRLPASPLSFSSNNISVSSVMDGSSIVQQSPHQEQVKQGASSATSESGNSMNAHKRSRINMRQGDILQQQAMQQFLQSRDSMQPQGYQNQQLQAMLQQQRIAQWQQQLLMQSPSRQSVPVTLLQQQQQLRNRMQPQAVPLVTPAIRPLDNGLCSRRLMQYLYHQRQRPSDNSIIYWRKFVAEYFAPGAKKKWCLSMYDSISSHPHGAFPQLARETWQCDLCGSKSGQGFEATFEVLPRLFQVKFDHGGVVDENMFLDMPNERHFSSGIMVLEYAKVVLESVYEHLRVVCEGQLQIIFTPELKICSWQFCARKHEEFLSKRMLAPQVNQLLQVSHKYQTAVIENGSAGVPHQELQASCNMFAAAGRQLAINFDLQSLNDLGFSKRYVRCLQISEVVNSMKDLIDFDKEHKCGAIESLKNYTSQAAAKRQKQKMQEPESLVSAQCLPVDCNTLPKGLDIHPGLGRPMNNDVQGSDNLNINQHGSSAPNDYQNILRGSLISNQSRGWQGMHNNSNVAEVAEPLQFQGHSLTNLKNHHSTFSLHAQQPQLTGCSLQQNNLHPSQINQHLQQHAMQKMLQGMMSNRGASQNSRSTSNTSGNTGAFNGCDVGINGMPATLDSGPSRNGLDVRNMPNSVPNNAIGAVQVKGNSFSSTNNPMVNVNCLKPRPNLSQDLDFPELHNITQFLTDNGVFSSDYNGEGYGWKL